MFGAIAWGALGGTQLDHENTKSIPMQRGARFAFSRSAPMQRGVRFAFCAMLAMQRGARFFLPPERSHAARRSFRNS